MQRSLIITGASSGIGRATALSLANWEGHLILSGRSAPRLADTAQAIIAADGKAEICIADLSDDDAIAKLVNFAEGIAPLYGLIHCGGAGQFAPADEQSVDVWRSQIETNLIGAYALSHYALKVMISRKSGHLIYVNSVAGLQSFPSSSAYVAAKHGLKGLADSLRDECREHTSKVTTIYPSATATEWWDKQEGDFPTDKMLTVEAVAEAAVFALKMSGDAVIEEIVLRHQAGDF